MSREKRTKRRERWQAVCSQAAVIMALATLFLAAALLSPVTVKGEKWMLPVCAAAVLADVILLVCLRGRLVRLPARIWKVVRENGWLILVLAAAALGRGFMVGNIQRWDAGEYYYSLGTACERFDFSPITYLGEFRLCNHPTLGMSFLASIGEFLTPRNPVGVHIVLLVMTLAALACLYQLFRGYFGHFSKRAAAAGTLVCACVPLIWGTFSYFNPDYFTLLFLIYLIYAEYRKKPLLIVFWGVLMSQTKETAIVVLFGYALVRLLVQLVTAGGGLTGKLRTAARDAENWCLLLCGLIYLCYLALLRAYGLSGWTPNSAAGEGVLTWSNTGMNCFGFQPTYIRSILRQLFVLNFAWVLWLGIAVLFIVSQVKRKRTRRPADVTYLSRVSGVYGAMAFYLIFTCLYVTYDIYRYSCTFVFFTAVFFVLGVGRTVKKKEIRETVMLAAAVLLGIQSFCYLDPISSRVFRFAGGRTGELLYAASYEPAYYGDFLVNNYAYTGVDRAMNQVLEDGGYDADTLVIVPGMTMSGLQLAGNGGAFTVNWDAERQVRTMRPLGDGVIPLEMMAAEELTGSEEEPVAILMLVSYYEPDEAAALELVSQFYEVGERRETEGNVSIVWYPLTKTAAAG